MKWTLKETPFPPLDDDSGNIHPEKMTSLPVPHPSSVTVMAESLLPLSLASEFQCSHFTDLFQDVFFFFFLMTDWSCSPQCSGSKGLPAPGLCSIFHRLSSWNSRPVRTQGLPLPGHFPQKTSVSLPLLLPPDGPRRLNCSCRLLYLQVFDSRVYIPCIISSFHIPAKYSSFRCVFWLHFRLSKPLSMHESHPRAPGMVHPLVSSFQSPASPSWLITCHIVRKNNYPARAKGWNFRTVLIFPPMLF